MAVPTGVFSTCYLRVDQIFFVFSLVLWFDKCVSLSLFFFCCEGNRSPLAVTTNETTSLPLATSGAANVSKKTATALFLPLLVIEELSMDIDCVIDVNRAHIKLID